MPESRSIDSYKNPVPVFVVFIGCPVPRRIDADAKVEAQGRFGTEDVKLFPLSPKST